MDKDVAVLTVNHPPVNALSHAVREGLMEAIGRAVGDPAVKAIVLLGSGTTFIAGADISEFGTPKSGMAPKLADVLSVLEASGKPVVAAIHGTALGGGLEVALACHARVAVAGAKVGLPEVKLGLLPGAGGTVRLPRLTGPEIALDLITSGRHVPAAAAREYGILDAIIDDLHEGSLAYARKLLAQGAPAPVRTRSEKIGGIDPKLFADYRKKNEKKWRGQIAPATIVDSVETACTKAFDEALAFESATFRALMAGDQRKALIHFFFAEREARKIPEVPDSIKPLPIRKAAIVGTGFMGGGIAMTFANAGIPVRVLDLDAPTLEKRLDSIRKNYATSVARGSMSQAAMDKAMAAIIPTARYEDLGDVDLVIEAVFEDPALKQEVFAALDRAVPGPVILGTNTSSLDIDKIAAATSRPDKVIGIHFFSPAHVMKLLENVRGRLSSAETIATVMALGKTLGKTPVLAGNCDGFLGNRMLQYYVGQAEYMLLEGATPEQIDKVAERFGMAMGPLAMRDLAGLDVAVRVRAVRRKARPDEPLPFIVERLAEAGRLGQKSGKGLYRYDGRDRLPDPEALAIIEATAKDAGVARHSFTDEEIRDRLFHPLVNEGAKELEEGIAIRSSDIDVAWVHGYAFPAHLGGPMFWGEANGLERVLQTARLLEKKHSRYWSPSLLLERLVAAGKGWADAGAFIKDIQSERGATRP